jgi:hypothetical protein
MTIVSRLLEASAGRPTKPDRATLEFVNRLTGT